MHQPGIAMEAEDWLSMCVSMNFWYILFGKIKVHMKVPSEVLVRHWLRTINELVVEYG